MFHRNATRCHIPYDVILHIHCRENLKSYLQGTVYALLSTFLSKKLHPHRSRVRFPALPDFLISSGSGTGSI
jgi:hypothetical protein